MTYSAGPELRVLGPGVGYGIIAGIGAVFTVVMLLTTKLQNRYSLHSTKQSEEFNTASRSVKPGLIAAGIGELARSIDVVVLASRLAASMLTRKSSVKLDVVSHPVNELNLCIQLWNFGCHVVCCYGFISGALVLVSLSPDQEIDPRSTYISRNRSL